ncbi:MAG: hypothetical protein QG673_1648 [Pseudomonadota bacterium]|nr:hypothetical protein [Pseudomonadota bacterium]
MENNQNKSNWFVRSLILVLGFIIILLVVSKFYFFAPKGDISNNLIILIILLIILFLSEIFDSFSLGQFLSLKKGVSERNERIKELRENNDKLLNLVINNFAINSNLSQKQITNINDYRVTQANRGEVDKVKNEEDNVAKVVVEQEINERPQLANRKRVNTRKLEKFVLDMLIENKRLQSHTLIKEAQVISSKEDTDPISGINPIFDAYVEKDNYEIFIEIKLIRLSAFMFRDRLYMMLSKLYHYKLAKKANVSLMLVLVEIPDEGNNKKNDYEMRLFDEFAPAISSGLLKIELIQLADNNMAELYD